MLLNGLWDFSFESGKTHKMPVPGCFDTDPRYYCRRGRGEYFREVECGGRVELSFEGLGLRGEIYWDGEKIGEEPAAYTPLTLRFHAGERKTHILKVVCNNEIDESPSSQFHSFYDFYGYGGIYRDVSLRELPETSFQYVKVVPLSPEEGRILLHVELDGPEKPFTVKLEQDGQLRQFPSSGDYELQIEDPHLWSCEDPFLYHLHLSTGEEEKKVTFGLRSIKAEKGKLYLNGKELFLTGVNRHDSHPQYGAALPLSQLRNDLQMIKDAGFNCVRGSHYPQSSQMLEIADELGLLVWEETLAWGNTVESLANEEFIRIQLDAMKRTIRRSINHPSIICWGFLNEGATSSAEAREIVKRLMELIRAEDPGRPALFATMCREKDVCLDLVDIVAFNTYPGWYSMRAATFDPASVKGDLDFLASLVVTNPVLAEKPILISEIGAAALVGDHSGRPWSEEYQRDLAVTSLELVRKDPRYSGILFWQFCNSPVDDNGRYLQRPRGYNNKGLADEYRRPKLAWEDLRKVLQIKKMD